MLIEFTVENFRSVKEAQTLSMLATKHREHPENIFETGGAKNFRLLRSAAIYGANASGKSNIIRALQTFKNFVVNSTDLKVGEKIEYYEPHLLDVEWADRPTWFEMELIANDGIRYRYSVSFNSEKVEREELVFFPKKQEARLFLREKEKIKFGDYLKGKKQSIAEQLLPNNLFLSKAANSNHKQLQIIYDYFKKLSNILDWHLNMRRDYFSSLTTYFLAKLEQTGEKLKNQIEQFMTYLDTGIRSIHTQKRNRSEDDMKKSDMGFFEKITSEYKILSEHTVYKQNKAIGSINFKFDTESNGTQRLYGLAGWIFAVLENGEILIIDELENSLHPLISEFIVRLFNDPKTNPNNAQLIFATHDTSLLNSDLMRRDQIWFTEKDECGATQLYSLAEFDASEVRKNTPFASWYLTGRFGALPMIDRSGFSIFDKQEQDGDDAQEAEDKHPESE